MSRADQSSSAEVGGIYPFLAILSPKSKARKVDPAKRGLVNYHAQKFELHRGPETTSFSTHRVANKSKPILPHPSQPDPPHDLSSLSPLTSFRSFDQNSRNKYSSQIPPRKPHETNNHVFPSIAFLLFPVISPVSHLPYVLYDANVCTGQDQPHRTPRRPA